MEKVTAILSVFFFINNAHASASASPQSQKPSSSQLQDAQEATKTVRHHTTSLTHYPGSEQMHQILRKAIDALHIDPKDASWREFLFNTATIPTEPPLDGKSARWVLAYTSIMRTLSGKLTPIARYYRQECQNLYPSECDAPPPSSFDHWTSSKAYEN